MGLFSRKKKNDRASTPDEAVDQTPEPTEPDADVEPSGHAAAADGPEEPAGASGEAPTDAGAPSVNISMSSFQGLGSTGGEVDPATAQMPAEPAAPEPQAATRPQLPAAPAAPPTNLETVPGLRDNALVRDALAAMPEKPSGAQIMGVVRQMMQGHLYLRVQGDARQKLAEGGQVTFGVAKAGDKDYMMAFSSGAALREAVKADGDAQTSAIGQPAPALVKHLLAGTFSGLILDNYSQPRRAVVPREILEKAFEQADPEQRIKTLLTQPREADTPAKLAELLAEQPPVWVAVGEITGGAPAPEGEKKFGVAEARLADGTRLLQVFSHPLEVVALGRKERAMPMQMDKIAKMLKDNAQIGGVIVDPAGPLMTLTREELAPVIALAE